MSTTEVQLAKCTSGVSTVNPAQSLGERQFEYVDLSAVHQDEKRITGSRWISGRDAPSRARQVLAGGDVLVSTVRPNLNAVARVEDKLEGAIGSTGFCVLRPGEHLDSNYLFHWVRSPQFVRRMVRAATGASYPAVSDRVVRDSMIPLPDTREQRRIARVLDAADALRAWRRDVIARLGALVESIYVDMFGDPRSPCRRWPAEEMGSLASVVRGASPRPAGDPRYFGGSIPWLKIADVTATSGRHVRTIKEGVTEAGAAKSVLLPAGTMILTNSATVGLPKFLGSDACIHDGFLALRNIDSHRVDEVFLYVTILLRRDQIADLAPMGTQRNLNTGIVRALSIELPPLDLQHEFAHRFVRTEKIQDAAHAQLMGLDETFVSLQDRAFKGEL